MIINKIIVTSIDITNPLNIFSDAERNILNILKDRFENRCYDGSFILSVNKLLKRSDCIINQDGRPGMGTLNVVFEVTALIYRVGEIINGCIVVNVNKEHKTTVCSTQNASIMITASDKFESIQKEQIISVRVIETKYNIGAPKISVSAIPFVPTRSFLAFAFVPLTIEYKDYIQPALDKLRVEEEAFNNLKKSKPKAVEWFATRLYAYKYDAKKLAFGTPINIMEFINKPPKDAKYVARDPCDDQTEPIMRYYKSVTELPEYIKIRDVGIQSKDILLTMVYDYYNWLKTIREMVEIYSDPKVLNAHTNLWKIYEKAKV